MKTLLSIVGFICTAICTILLACIFYSETYPTSLIFYESIKSFSTYVEGPITRDTVIRGHFIAKYNNLGTLTFRINTFNRLNDNTIIFRLREKGMDWNVTNRYVTDRFINGAAYPFGFPQIADSKGKTYEFELYSDNGTPGNSIGVRLGSHAISSQYIYSKQRLIENRREAKQFLIDKVLSLFSDSYFLIFLSAFFFPSWFVCKTLLGKNSDIDKRGLVASCVYLCFVYIYLPLSMRSEVILFITGIITGMMLYLRMPVNYMYVGSFIFLIQIPLAVYCGNYIAANKIAVLIFFILSMAVCITLLPIHRIYNRKH